ncbi:MAG: hypothetical protein PHI06_03675 [Desulfobulbaceae bacterium]|nr:hypothetical protein [Desulfobulbaceae bacterium]
MRTKAFKEERRLFSRFTFEEGALVVNQNIIGLLDNISLGGASFQYFDKGQGALDGSALEIILPFGNILIKAGQYAVVAPASLDRVATASNQAQVKKYHLRFVGLASSELQSLWQMIKIHSVRSWDESAFLPIHQSQHKG